MNFAQNQFGFNTQNLQVSQQAATPTPDFSDVPPPSPRRKPRRFSGTTYSSTIAPFDSSMWRVGMPRFGAGVSVIPAGESSNARRSRRQRAKGQFFSFPLYATPPSGSRLDFRKLMELRSGLISDETLKNARYFSEILGAGAYARNYDFYISAVAKAALDLTNYGPYSINMRSRYWQPYANLIESFRSNRPVAEAGGDSGPQNINDDLRLFWEMTAANPSGNRGQSFQILRSLAKQIFKGQIDRGFLVHQTHVAGNPEANLSISPEYWLASKAAATRVALLDKTPYGEINVTLDSGDRLRMPLIRALRLLSGAAWLNNTPTDQTRNVIREYADYYSRGIPRTPFNFEVSDWGSVDNVPFGLMDIVYFYGYWSYLKARSRDTDYWRRAFEEEILHPTACQLPRQRFYQGFLPEITSESNLTAATRDAWTQEFEDYCQSIGLPVLAADRMSREAPSGDSSPATYTGLLDFAGQDSFARGVGFDRDAGFVGMDRGVILTGGSADDELPPSGTPVLPPPPAQDPAPMPELEESPSAEEIPAEDPGGTLPDERDDTLPDEEDVAVLEPESVKKKLSGGQIAGIAVGSVAAAAGLLYLLRK